MRPHRLGDSDAAHPGSLPLFGDIVQFDPNPANSVTTGTWYVNHDWYKDAAGMHVAGANQSFTDGHGEWIDSPTAYPDPLLPNNNSDLSHVSGGNYWGCWWWY